MNGFGWAVAVAMHAAEQAGMAKKKTKRERLAEWREDGKNWSKYVGETLAELGADSPKAKRRSDKDDACVVRDMRQKTGGGDAFEAWKEAHIATQSIKEELANVLGETGEIADDVVAKATAGKYPSGALTGLSDKEKRIRELLRQLESAEIEERVLAQLALYGKFICSKDMKDWCEAQSDKDTHCVFVSASTDEPWEPPDDKGSGGVGAAPDEEAVDAEGADASGESDEPSLSDEKAPAESEEATVTPEGTTPTQETKSVARAPKVPPPPPPSKKGEPAEKRPEGSTHTFARPRVPPPPPPPIGPPLFEKQPVQPPGALVEETVSVAFQQQPPPPPPAAEEEEVPVLLLPHPRWFDPDRVPPPGGTRVDAEPPPLSPGIQLDLSQVKPDQHGEAVIALNDGLNQIGITWMVFSFDPSTGKITLRYSTNRDNPHKLLKNDVVQWDDPRVTDMPETQRLIQLVNTPHSVLTLTAMNDAASIGTKYRKRASDGSALQEEVTLTMSQPGEDSVFYFNTESYERYTNHPTAKAAYRKFGNKDPLNPVAMLYHELVEANELAGWRETLPADLRKDYVNPGAARVPPPRGDADGAHDLADATAMERERSFRREHGLPLRTNSPGFRTSETAAPGHEQPSTLTFTVIDTRPTPPGIVRQRTHQYIIGNGTRGEFESIRIRGLKR